MHIKGMMCIEEKDIFNTIDGSRKLLQNRKIFLIMSILLAINKLDDEITSDDHILLANEVTKLLCKLKDDDIIDLIEANHMEDDNKKITNKNKKFEIEHSRIHHIHDYCSDILFAINKCSEEFLEKYYERTVEVKKLIERKLDDNDVEHDKLIRQHKSKSKPKYINKSRTKVSRPQLVSIIKAKIEKRKQKEIEDFQAEQLRIHVLEQARKNNMERRKDLIYSSDYNLPTLAQLEYELARASTGSSTRKNRRKNASCTKQNIQFTKNLVCAKTNLITEENIDSNRPFFLNDKDYELYNYIFSKNLATSGISKTSYYYNDAIKLLYAFGGYRLVNCGDEMTPENLRFLTERKHGSHIIIKLENSNKISQTFSFVQSHEYLYKYEIEQLRDKLTKFGFTPDRIMLAKQ